ncbi:hypothetical protein HDU76_005807 [Blyttiomyces sp. JEL0837]|nr:hypothetical protein HDU76_005807 [Blyttiomyces sp. JEL0837]
MSASRKSSVIERTTAVFESSKLASNVLLRRNSVKDTNQQYQQQGGQSPASPVTPSDQEVTFSMNPEDYELGTAIGYGSSATVYIAKYKPMNKIVAIKMIDRDMFERNQIDELRREIQIMSLSRHPNLLPVYGSFVNGSRLFIVTPFLSGGSCLDIMKTAYPHGLDEMSIATILKQALQGLEYLHKNGLIHRDVKAGNLLMDEDGLVRLADFGVSSSLMDTGERKGIRKTFVGTPCWMAPEVMEQSGYDYKADIWSFGITALELATGHAPFAKYPPIKVLMLTLQNDPPTLDREQTAHKYSKSFKDLIDCCLQKDPSKSKVLPRPTCEKLLTHAFFKQATKKRQHLVTDLLQNLPPITQRNHNRKTFQINQSDAKGISWDFSSLSEDDKDSPERTVGSDGSGSSAEEVLAAAANQHNQQQQQQYPRLAETLSSPSSSPITLQNLNKPIKSSPLVLDSILSSSPQQQSMPQLPIPQQPQQQGQGQGQPLSGATAMSQTPSASGSVGGEIRKGRFSVTESIPTDGAGAGSAGMSPGVSPGVSPGMTPPNMAPSPSLEGTERKTGRFAVQPVVDQQFAMPPLPQQSSMSDAQRPSRFTVTTSDANIAVGAQPVSDKRGRFEVSAMDKNVPVASIPLEKGSSSGSPNSSPSGSLSRASRFTTSVVNTSQSGNPSTPPGTTMVQGSADSLSVNERLDTILRQNDQQRTLLNELINIMARSGMNVSEAAKNAGLMAAAGPGAIPFPMTGAGAGSGSSAEGAGPSSQSQGQGIGSGGSAGAGAFAGASGAVNTSDITTDVLRENDALRRDNDTLRANQTLLQQQIAHLLQEMEAIKRQQQQQ